MEESVIVYYRDGAVYLQALVLPTDMSGKWMIMGMLTAKSIIVVQPTRTDLATRIPEALSYSIAIAFTDLIEVENYKKAYSKLLLKLSRTKSYKQFDKGATQLILSRRDNKIRLDLGYPDVKHRAWVGKGGYESDILFDAPFNYEEIAEAMLKHLLNPANRYPEA
ncbi:MAG: hypothetical protein KME04_17035 [Pleurocapsa minor GSE-CHR-MK-17-07R]|jgi:hypothetical protein|nr:hypothetical protein [Pleurocapsa minor GSE-CHR-MK 17-07R]